MHMRAIRNIVIIGVMAAAAYTSVGCSGNSETKTTSNHSSPIKCAIIADTIIYDVQLAPIDSSNTWESFCLKGLDRQLLIDHIFDGIYSGKYVAFDFYSNNKLQIDEVRGIEKAEGYSRDKITKIQFKEIWSTDPTGIFRKRVIGMTLGVASYSKQHTFLGHTGLLRVEM